MKRIYLLMVILMTGLSVSAQHYLNSAGMRTGRTSGITYKKFVARDNAVEFMLSGRNNGLQANAQYQFYSPANFSFDQNFVVYYGVGGHFGFERLYPYEFYDNVPFPEFDYRRRPFAAMGIDVIAGVEYRLLSVPLTLALDIKPYMSFIGFRYLDGGFWDVGFSVKYVFND